MKLFDYVVEWREQDPTITWEQLAVALDILPENTIEDPRSFANGEILRSWYRRQKKNRQSLKNDAALESQTQNAETAQNSPKAVNPSQGIHDALQTLSEAFRGFVWDGNNLLSKEVTEEWKDTGTCPESRPNPFASALHLDAVPTLVIGDLHAPYHDHEWLQKVVAVTQDELYEVERIIVGGDLFNFDVVSRHSKAHFVERLETELAYAGELILWLASIAPLVIMNGNHDERIANKLDAGLSLRRIVAMSLDGRTPDNEITVTDYDYMLYGDTYVIGHLDRGAAIPGKAAHSIISKYKRHVLTFHEHSRGVFTGTNNPHAQYIGASVGCSTSTEKHWYAMRRLNSQKPFAKGFALISDDDLFSLYDDNAEEYYARYAIRNGVYNCFKV